MQHPIETGQSHAHTQGSANLPSGYATERSSGAKRLAGRVALVTGAARGIGAAIARRFASEGANLLVVDQDLGAAQQVCSEIQASSGTRALAFGMNVASAEDNDRATAEAVQQFGRLDILVCSAGIVRQARPIEEITPEDWQQVMDVNLMGCVYATRAFAAHAKRATTAETGAGQHAPGRIIFIASVAGQVGGVSAEMTYAVSKAGVLCLCKSVARQLGPYGITVNCISPGTIETDMTRILDYPDAVMQSIALGRYGAVDDIASAAAYLASDEGQYITGASLDVNGGIFMR